MALQRSAMEYIFYFTLSKVVSSKGDIFLCVLAFFSSKNGILSEKEAFCFNT